MMSGYRSALRTGGVVMAALMLAASAGCSNNDDDEDEFTEPAPPPVLPAAVAGDDFEVAVNTASVTLNGSKSVDLAGGALTFSWAQTAGTAVTLSDPAVASPPFTAPGAEVALTFQLTVTGAQGSDSDTVKVSVKNLLVTAPDTWFVGYGKPGSIAASVSVGTGPYSYEWLDLPPWLNASGTNSPTLTFTTPRLTDFQVFPDVAA